MVRERIGRKRGGKAPPAVLAQRGSTMFKKMSVFVVVGVVSGCGLVSQLFPGLGNSGSNETGSAKLIPFRSQQELRDYFVQQMDVQNTRMAAPQPGSSGDSGTGAEDGGSVTGDAAAPGVPEAGGPGADLSAQDGSSNTGFSGTTIQEAGVDESDVVKTDGTYLYLISNGMLKIVRVSPPEQLDLTAEVALDGWGQDLYLHDGKVIALTNTGGGFFYFEGGGIAIDPMPVDATVVDESGGTAGSDGTVGDGTTDGAPPPDVKPETPTEDPPTDISILPVPYEYERPRSVVTVIDVSTPGSPTILSQTKFDGSVQASRMIDGVMHFVLANFQNYYFDIMPMLGRPEFDSTEASEADVLPTYTRVNADGSETSGDVVSWENLYRPTDPDGFGVVTLVSLDVDADAAFTAVGIVAEPGLMYSSLEAAYLTDTQYDWTGNARETTDLYKFAYSNRGATPVATGTVTGRVLNQYSMGEFNGNLRVATTIDARFECGFFDCQQVEEAHNNVYVLGQVSDALSVLGSVTDIAPRETIQSARFMGNRGYVVTFEQVDPLFTLDLSDPANPRIMGELKVPGFSTFIVPMDENHLLTVGQYIPEPGGPEFRPWGVQLSIFDITDFANPVQQWSEVVGADAGAYSEALWNPKAFTYYAEQGLVALPISIYADTFFFGDSGGGSTGAGGSDVVVAQDGSATGSADTTVVEPAPDAGVNADPYIPPGFDGVAVYRVTVTDGFTELGRISTRFEDAGIYWASFTRGVFIGDDVFAVTDNGVRGAPVSDLANPPFSLLLADPVDWGVSEGGTGEGTAVLTDPVR